MGCFSAQKRRVRKISQVRDERKGSVRREAVQRQRKKRELEKRRTMRKKKAWSNARSL